MNIRKEINEHAKDEDRPILLWLFKKYHMSSQWGFVAKCTHVRYGKPSYKTNRVWCPTEEGRILFNHFNDSAG